LQLVFCIEIMKMIYFSAILIKEMNIIEVENMIVQLKGKVAYPITLDPTVWIFDDRKVLLEEAFMEKEPEIKEDPTKKAAELFNQEIYSQKQIKPPVNKSLNSEERKMALIHSFVMPIKDFVHTAEVQIDAERAILKTDGDDVIITIEQLNDALILFAVDGKPVKDHGPIHLYFGDGSNQDAPIKGIKQIIID